MKIRKRNSILILIIIVLAVFTFRVYLEKSIESTLREEFGVTEAETNARSSLVVIAARKDLEKGQLVNVEDLAKKNIFVRDIAISNTYISAKANLKDLIGRTMATNVKKGTPLSMSDFKNGD